MGLSGMFGRSMACTGGGEEEEERSAWLPCEICDARGEVDGLRCVEGAVMLWRDDDECARAAPGASSV